MTRMELPILENDLDEVGVIEPSEIVEAIDIPSKVVVCFFREVVETIAARGGARLVSVLEAAHGTHPIYEVRHAGQRLAVFHRGVGAPLAAAFLEETIALGGRTFVAVGGAGALAPDLLLGHAVVVDSAVRDEGTSYHYLAPSRTVDADPAARIARRIAEGCLTVEMEAAAFFAAARYRNVAFAQLVYAGDSLASRTWDDRGWRTATSVREQLFWLAADGCLQLSADRAGDVPLRN